MRLVSVPFTDTVEFHSALMMVILHSRAIKRASTQHCGAVGRAWIEYLANNQDMANQKVTFKRKTNGYRVYPKRHHHRLSVSRYPFLPACWTLPQSYQPSITGWDNSGECSRFIRNSFNEWLENYGTGNRENTKSLNGQRDFIQRYGLNRFQPYTLWEAQRRFRPSLRRKNNKPCGLLGFWSQRGR